MRKVAFILVLVLLLTMTTPVYADIYLTSLSINEEIIPGSTDIFLTVTGHLSNGVKQSITEGLIWRSSDYSIATISTGGRLHFTGKGGTVTITVSKGGASGSKTINVRPWPTSLDIETTLVYSENPYRLMVKGRFSDGQERYFGPEDNLVWTTSNPFVAWVNNQGVVTFTGEPGYVSITARWGNLSDWVAVSVPSSGEGSTVWRTGIKIKEEEISYSDTPVKLTLVAVMSDGSEEELPNAAADWSSSNTDVASINSEGELSFTGKQGVTQITVKYGGYTYVKTVTVGRFLKSIKIRQSLNYTPNWEGVPIPLSVTGKYNDGTEIPLGSGVTWSVDNKKVAGITADGVITFTGEAGKVVVKASAAGYGDTVVEDSLEVVVPEYTKAKPQRLFIKNNIYSSDAPIEPQAFCIYDDGSLRDVTAKIQLYSRTPQTASVFQNKIYMAPNPGPVRVQAVFEGLSDELTGYINVPSGRATQVQQVFIKEHDVAFTYREVQLTALAVMGDGSIKDVTKQVTWRSSQPLVAKVSKGGVLTFTGRIGSAVISMQGFGFRDELTLQVSPAETKSRVESLVITGDFTKTVNQLKALATFNDGTVKDVTDEAVWNTDNREYAPVFKGSVIFPQGSKPVTITAHYGGMEATIRNY